MKAITIKQPWASLIAHGIKPIENRSWKTKFRGTVLIHSAAKPAKGLFKVMDNEMRRLAGVCETWKPLYFSDLPHSAIIGKVDIVDCVINHPSIWAEKGALAKECPECNSTEFINKNLVGDGYRECRNCGQEWWIDISYEKPIYNWVLENAVLFPEPILGVKGKLSFWDYPNIASDPEEDNEKLFCHCQIPVKEENQVWNLLGQYICKYCDGIWYK